MGSKLTATVDGVKYVSKGLGLHHNETGMEAYVGSMGPLSVCVDASSWQLYKRGVLTKHCGLKLDHCVQVTGYNKEANVPYWIVRNSWNTDWGEDGYIYVKMGSNKCGIANEATFSTGDRLTT